MYQRKLVAFAILAAASLAISPALKSELAYADKAPSPTVLKECEKLYLQYRELGQEKFTAKYSYRAYFSDCLKLYKDPNWTFPGKAKLDNYFDKIDVAKSKSNLGTSDIKSVKIIQKLKIGQANYFVKFQACASDTGIASPTFLIQSDTEKFIAKSSKILQSNKCLSYSTEIASKYSGSISLKFVNYGPLYEGLKVKTI